MKKTVCILLVLSIVCGAMLSCKGREVQGDRADAPTAGGGLMRVLVLGCDRAASLADSILLFTVDASAHVVSVLQIPRDTYAEYTSRSYKKINGALNALGIDGMVAMLEKTFGVDVDAYVTLKPDALVGIVDAIGGLDLSVPMDMDYSDPAQGLEIHLKAGPAHLDGKAAEQFVRFRSGYANADLGRLDAQKLFLQALAVRCSSLSFSETLNAAMHAMTTVQTNLSLPAAIRLITALRACDAEEIPMQTLPGAAIRGESGAWYYVVNRAGAMRVVNELLRPALPLGEEQFDPDRMLDRALDPRFHSIYEMPEAELLSALGR